MRKALIILMCLMMCFTVSCNLFNDDGKDDDNNDNNPGDNETMNYEDLYKNEITAPYDVLPNTSAFKASYGYTLKTEQGYNHWYYQSGAEFTDMTYDETKKCWSYQDAYFDKGVFKPSKTNSVALSFKAPASGNVTIKGNYRMNKAGVSAGVKIVINTVQIYPETGLEILDGSDLEGVYHETTRFLNSGDTVRFIVEANGNDNQEIYWNPTVDYTNTSEQSLHYDVNGEFFGDVHPYYYNGKMYMYYLKTGGTFQSQLMTSENMVNYQKVTMYQDEKNMPEMDNYYVIGVYNDGTYFRTYYGLGNAMGSAKSKDLITWSNGAETGPNYTTLYKCFHDYDTFPSGGRDPFCFYDPDIDRYRLVALYYYKNTDTELDRAIGLRTTTDAAGSLWDTKAKSLVRFPTRADGEPECPMMMKIGKRWYLFSSLGQHTTHWVGGLTYWMGNENTKIDDDNWSTKEELRLDGDDLCAAQLVKVGDKVYMYGWMPQQYNAGVWGGYLNIAREVVVRADGTLGGRIDPAMTKLLNRGRLFGLDNSNYSVLSGSVNAVADGLITNSGNTEIKLDGYYKRSFVTFDMKMGNATKAGYVMKQGDQRYEVVITKDSNGTYMQIGNPYDSSHPISSKIRIGDSTETDFSIKAVIEGGIVEFFVNDNWALTGRIAMTLNNYEAILYSNGTNTSFTNVTINKLATATDIFD